MAEARPPTDMSNEARDPALEPLLQRSFSRVVILSDLHLGPGAAPLTAVYRREENFFAGDALGRFLGERARAADGQLLVLNGDTFDFPRIPSIPDESEQLDTWSEFLSRLGRRISPEDLLASIGRTERKYGLRTQDFKAVWALLEMFRGHRAFFDALADWVRQGNALIVNLGNHDVQLYWPLVHRAIRALLVDAGAPAADVESSVAFCGGSFWLENVYVEHGHRFEAMTAINGPPVLEQAPDQLRLPLGSFINRYLINQIERLDPFIDNVKPVGRALGAILRRRPLYVLKLYFNSWRFIFRAVRMQRVLNRSVLTVLLGLVLPPIGLLVVVATLMVPELSDRVFGWVPLLQSWFARMLGGVGAILAPALLPYLAGAVREVAREFGFLQPHRPMLDGAREVLLSRAPRAEPRYVVFGHTHRPIVITLPDTRSDGRVDFYVNSGTWTARWERSRPDLHGRFRYTFVEFLRDDAGAFHHRLCVWNDDAGESRPATILGEDDQ